MKTRQFSMLCAAAVVCMTAQPFCAVSAATFTDGETEDGYDYSEFEDMYPGAEETAQGTHKLTVGEHGCFTCEWDGIFNYRAEVGRKFKTDTSFRYFGDVVFDYDMQINPRGNCWYGVHAKFADQHDLFIVDGWGSWRPPGGQGMLGTGYANGKVYNYYKLNNVNRPGIEGPENLTELWAVAATSSTQQNTTNRVNGEISISQHLRRLAELKSAYIAVYDSQLRCAALVAEGYGGGSGDSDCEMTVTKNNMYLQPHPTPIPEQPVVLDSGDGLKDICEPYFRIGGMIGNNMLQTPEAEASIVQHFNSVSSSNLTPRMIISGVDGTDVSVDFENASKVLSFAENNDIPVRGSSFFGIGSDMLLPDSMFAGTAEECSARIESLIKNSFMTIKWEYPNMRLYAYDVCTHTAEPAQDGFSFAAFGHQWSDIYGEGNDAYIVDAFKYARKYASSSTKLYLCDDQERQTAPDEAIEDIVKMIQKEGNYIDGVSLKVKVDKNTDYASYGSWLKKLAGLGMDIQFADVTVRDTADYSGESMKLAWQRFFAMAAEYADDISCVTLGRPVPGFTSSDEGPTALFGSNPDTGALIPAMDLGAIQAAMDGSTFSDTAGDANCDGVVDVSDAVLVMRYAVADREAVISEQGLKNADTDKNGNTDSDDATNILLHIAKKINLIK